MNLETVSNDTNPGRPLGKTQQKVIDLLRRRRYGAEDDAPLASDLATELTMSAKQVTAALERLRCRGLVRSKIVTERIGAQHYRVNRWWLR